jgi:cell division protein FtsZ
MGILTVGIVTKPFSTEHIDRVKVAEEGISTLVVCVDSLIVIPNDRIIGLVESKEKYINALYLADQVIFQWVRGIADIITRYGDMNIDFADIMTVMKGKGMAYIGVGSATGSHKALKALKAAIEPILLETGVNGATHVLVNYTGDIFYEEIDEANEYLASLADPSAIVIVGCIDIAEGDEGYVPDTASAMIVATGMH